MAGLAFKSDIGGVGVEVCELASIKGARLVPGKGKSTNVSGDFDGVCVGSAESEGVGWLVVERLD